MRALLSSARFLHVAMAALSYLLGLAIADYLGTPFNPQSALLGLAWVSAMQLGTAFLADAFRPLNEQASLTATFREKMVVRNQLVLVAAASLTSAGLVSIALAQRGVLVPAAVGLQTLAVVSAIAYGVPPFRLVYSGFGEMILSFLFAYFPASLGFVLQAGEYHRLLSLVTFPLVLLGLAWLVAQNFSSFAADQKYERGTLLRRIGWERGVPLHHALILAGFGLLIIGPAFGVSFSIVWPALLAVPFAVLEILLVRGIGLGARPEWTLLRAASTSAFGLATYLLALAFWFR